MPKAFGDDGTTHAEWRIQPTVLLMALDSEKAWCPHSCAVKVKIKSQSIREAEVRKFSHTDDPDAGAYQSSAKGVECPKSEPSERVGVRVRVLDAGRVNQQLNGDGGSVDDGEQKKVPDSGEGGRSVYILYFRGQRERKGLHVEP